MERKNLKNNSGQNPNPMAYKIWILKCKLNFLNDLDS